ncbi:MAG TPA: sulfatase-like hydrolase/transferase [Lentimicrobium sp.]|nr:sulfatase-like hydrolase/transferase [Lentimicrobium sp.]
MNRIVVSLLRQLVFWMVFFFIARALFLLYNIPSLRIEKIGVSESIAAFWHALPLDLATACYLLIFPFILLIIQALFKADWVNRVNKIYTLIAIILFSLLITAELGIYPEWKTKMPYKALNYLLNPSEIYNSASSGSFFLLIALFLFLSTAVYLLYTRIFYLRITNPPKKRFLFTPLFAIIVFPLLALGARGGWQQIPINQSESYYSTHNILNLASVNSAFNLSISFIENYKNLEKNPYGFYDLDEAKSEVEKIYAVSKDTTIKILTTNRPNIVLLILESWSADLIESIGGEPGITPEFHELEKNGILFTNLYATGPRSEQAMGSIFSGFPAHPISSVTVQPEKFSKLPTITHSLIKEGYATSFYFGGQLRYGNIRGYILHNGFTRVIEHNDFGKNVIRGKLGVHDEFVLSRQMEDLNKVKQPFFSGLFTLSSHSPYDQPMENVLSWGGNEHNYINSAYYTDRCLGNYFREAAKQPWFDNTLFIIVADHSHNSYRNWTFTSPSYHKIPLLLYGNVIKEEYKGQKINRLANQMDIATTLLNQLDIDSTPFKWSRDLFNPYSPVFAYYSFEEGFGWITKDGHFVYEPRTDHYHEDAIPDSLKEFNRKQGKSFLQVLFDEYMKL